MLEMPVNPARDAEEEIPFVCRLHDDMPLSQIEDVLRIDLIVY
jgi:hypothetical protein